jgi:WD40 repeat protein
VCSTKRLLLTLGLGIVLQACYDPDVPRYDAPSGGEGGQGGAQDDPTPAPTGSGGSSAPQPAMPQDSGGRDDEVSDVSEELDAPSPVSAAPDCTQRLLPCTLPPPCRGRGYSVTLSLPEDRQYAWRALETPPGLDFSEETGTLSGVASESGTLHLQLLAGTEVAEEASVDLVARDSCWFAYVEAEAETTLLHLVDPLLDVERSVPGEPAAGQRVLDFEFSPDGRYIAVKSADDSGNTRLQAFQAPEWDEIALPWNEAVGEYAWSPNSSVLAVELEGLADSSIAGVRMPSASDASVRLLAPIPAQVASDLTWLGEQGIMFFTTSGMPDGYVQAAVAPVSGDGFAAVALAQSQIYSVEATTTRRMEPARDGVFAVGSYQGQTSSVAFYHLGPEGLVTVSHQPDVVPSPGRGYVARTNEMGELEIYGAGDVTQPDSIDPPLIDRVAGCGHLLAWSPREDRLACVTSGDVLGNVRLVSFDPAEPSTIERVQGEYTYNELLSAQRARAFSADGKWFVFATDSRLYEVDTSSERLLARSGELVDSNHPFPEFAFSPDGTKYLRHEATSLFLHSLEPDYFGTLLPRNVEASRPCSESVGPAADAWCGTSTMRGPHVSWEPDSRYAIYESQSGALIALSLTPSPSIPGGFGVEDRAITRECAPKCIRSFEFQPKTR